VEGTKRDITAAQNGIAYKYNNGLAEGSVNKIKVKKELCMVEFLPDIIKVPAHADTFLGYDGCAVSLPARYMP